MSTPKCPLCKKPTKPYHNSLNGELKGYDCIPCDIIDVENYKAEVDIKEASGVSYDNTGSGLSSTNLQDAFDELDSETLPLPFPIDPNLEDTEYLINDNKIMVYNGTEWVELEAEDFW